jgi:inner membrane protein
MDNLTHTLVGAALAETGLKRATPLATLTLLIAANFPDIDIIAALFGSLTYLEHHRGLTHSILGLPILSALLAAGVYGSSRLMKRRAESQPRARFIRLFVLSLLAMATHPLLDFTNNYGWRPFLPWSNRWYYGDLAFVIDLWIWAGLGSVVFISTAKNAARTITYGMVSATAATFLVTAGAGLRILWPLAICAAIAAGLRFVIKLDHAQARKLNLGALTVLLIYFGALTGLHHLALRRATAVGAAIGASEQVIEVNALPAPANPFLWRAVIATDTAFHLTDLHLLGEGWPPPQRRARETGDREAIQAARRTAEGQTFLRFARFPIAAARRNGQQTEVEIRDIRFLEAGDTFRIIIRVAED